MANNNRRKYKPNNYAQKRPQVEIACDKETQALPIEELGLPADTYELLKKNNINFLYDVLRRTERDMFRIQTFNKKHLFAVKAGLAERGLGFLPPLPKPESGEKTDGGRQPDGARHSDVGQNGFNNNKPQQPRQDVRQNRPNDNPPKNGNRDRDKKKNGIQQKQERFERQPKVELPLEEWRKIKRNNKWGFSNGLRTVIEPKFDEVFSFKDGLACVEVDEKFGYINSAGDYVIEPQYECALSFSEGLAVVFENEKCGYINKQNEIVIACKYDAAVAFENGRAKVKEDGKWGTIAPDGTTLWTK